MEKYMAFQRAQETFHFIIIDIEMPAREHGLALLAAIRNYEAESKLRPSFIAGMEPDSEVLEARGEADLKEGFNEVVSKPLNRESFC
jgi:CheY-like chemotaxis protein